MKKKVFQLLFTVTIQLFLSTVILSAEENKVHCGEFVVEPPTLISLGFEWYIEGDDNRNAGVFVRYREKGEADWREALPLLHLDLHLPVCQRRN